MSEQIPTAVNFDALIERTTSILASILTPENSPKATIIRGKAKWQTCWRQACYLSKYIYKDPPPPDGFHTQFPEKMAQVEEHWEVWDESVEQSESGLVARLFKVKGYDPSSKTDTCPPTLVFRGTDFEDMRNLVVMTTFRLGPKREEFIYSLDNTDPSQKSGHSSPLKRMLISQEKLTCPNALVQNLNSKP